MDIELAIINQQIAAKRHRWVESDREEYYTSNPKRIDWVSGVIRWSDERAHYARMAMKAMGITEEDQYYV